MNKSYIGLAAAVLFAGYAGYGYFFNANSALQEKLDQIYIESQSSLSFSSSLIAVLNTCKGLRTPPLGMDTDWSEVETAFIDFESAVETLSPESDAETALKNKLAAYAAQISTGVKDAAEKKQQYLSEDAGNGVGKFFGYYDPEKAKKEFEVAVDALTRKIKECEKRIKEHGQLVGKSIGNKVAEISEPDIDPEVAQEAINAFGQRIDAAVNGTASAGSVDAGPETIGKGIKEVFGNTLTPKYLYERFQGGVKK